VDGQLVDAAPPARNASRVCGGADDMHAWALPCRMDPQSHQQIEHAACGLREKRERLARPGRPARNDGVRNNGEERRRRSRRRRHKRDGGRAEGAVLCACMMHAVDTHEFLFVAILFYLGTRQLIHHHKKGEGKKTNSGGLESVCMLAQSASR
jgi:hypothetical protein